MCAGVGEMICSEVGVKFGFYTIIVPMPQISACIPWHRYRPEGGIRAYATGYRQISVALGTILSYIRGIRARGYRQISVAYATG